MDKVKIWNDFINELKNKVSDVTFNTWFINLKLLTINDKDIVIIVPYSVHKNHIINNYMDIIEEIFLNITGKNLNIVFCLEGEYKENTLDNIEKIGLDDSVIENFVEARKTNLNPKYTFDNFVVGDSNRFAFSSCLSVAQNPGKLYNPLFLYGKSGLGKTHLMHAIGNYIVQNTNLRVLYITTDEFMNEFISITRDSGNKEDNFNYIDIFKEKYRDVDVLMIDDIQFLGGATQTQQEFFHTFNTLYSDSKQIIISSDRSPDDLKLLEDRLRTRFCWGLTVNIFPPDFNLRVEIIKRKIIAGNFEKEISEDVIEYIASNMGSDVRQLEGSITRLVAYSAIMGGSEINLELAIEALKDFISKGISEKNDVHRIQKVVAEYFQISVEDIRSKKRSSNIAFPRQIAMYLCRKLTSESFPKIGTEFGGKDHSTVMHSVEKIENEIKVNPDLANIIEKIKEDIQ